MIYINLFLWLHHPSQVSGDGGLLRCTRNIFLLNVYGNCTNGTKDEAEICCVSMQIHCWYIFEWGTLVTRTQEDTLFPSFSTNNRLSLFIPLPSPVPPSPAFSLVLSVSGSVPPNIRGSPVICDPSNPHLISLKRGSIHFAAWRAPNRPSLLWQVSTLANNWSPVPCPVPQCDTEPKLFEANWKEPHNREWGGEERRGRTRERLHSQTAISWDEAFLNKQKKREEGDQYCVRLPSGVIIVALYYLFSAPLFFSTSQNICGPYWQFNSFVFLFLEGGSQ